MRISIERLCVCTCHYQVMRRLLESRLIMIISLQRVSRTIIPLSFSPLSLIIHPSSTFRTGIGPLQHVRWDPCDAGYSARHAGGTHSILHRLSLQFLFRFPVLVPTDHPSHSRIPITHHCGPRCHHKTTGKILQVLNFFV